MYSIVLIVLVYLIFQMVFVWLLASILKNPSIIDFFWPLGLMISGLIYLFSEEPNTRTVIISILLSCWALRLASHLFFNRIINGIVDKRYLSLSEDWKSKSLGYFLNFQLQGFFIFIMSSVFFLIILEPSYTLNTSDWVAIVLCLFGIVGESIADLQLENFKKRSSGKVCNIGLWYFSRHPNYFFDWLTWCGFALFAIRADYGWSALVSPLLLYIIMNYMTGPLTERASIKSRGNLYLEYQRTTPMFFPWFKK